MKQAEVAHYRAMLQAQAAEPRRRGIFALGPVLGPVLKPAHDSERSEAAVSLSRPGVLSAAAGPPPPRSGSLFGRRPPEPPAALADTLVLDRPVQAPARLRLRPSFQAPVADTPYHEEDLADPPTPAGPAPGVIAGWSSVRPPSAQVRLLRRLGAVIEAERQGLAARLAAAGVEPA